ncbi:MAG: hypothetical protein ACPHSD_19645 [Candidatus Latescibacterota bacterium]|jgi:hypothetical protein
MKIKFIDKEQDWANETTRYWFNVDGDEYCIADQNDFFTLLDCDMLPLHRDDGSMPQGNASDQEIYRSLSFIVATSSL